MRYHSRRHARLHPAPPRAGDPRHAGQQREQWRRDLGLERPFFVLINLVVDLLYYAVDPRLRIEAT
jgi:hypothetical protein